jgi:two-component sensor histidine kinase
MLAETEAGTMRGEGLDGVERVLAYVPPANSSGGLLVSVGIDVNQAMAPFDRAMRRDLALIGITFVVALATAILAGFWLMRRPLGRLLRTARLWEQGDYAARAGAIELQALAAAADRMAVAVQERDATQARLLEQRSMLLRELEHRVKNNLQMVRALLQLQGTRVVDPAARAAFADAGARIAAIGDIYGHLTLDHGTTVNVRDYLDQLVRRLCSTLAEDPAQITLDLDLEVVRLPADRAVPLGIAVNEIVTNCFKHGFAGRAAGRLSVSLHHREGAFRLSIADDGPGLPAHPDGGGLGLTLIRALVAQARAELTLATGPGARFVIEGAMAIAQSPDAI